MKATTTKSRVAKSTITDDNPAPKAVDPTLATILMTCRPHGSDSELKFGKWLFDEIAKLGADVKLHTMGNIVATVPRKDDKGSDVLFSCHIDTVHQHGGEQLIAYDASFGHIFLLKEGSKSNCLGADDGAGVWLMLEMIKASMPGTYIFHRGEERGGIGSNAMRDKESDFLKKFNLAVAFDRPNTDEVITHQGGVRTCSEKFAVALSTALNKTPGLNYAPSASGVFTDTKVYRGLIAECTNLGVGYAFQHSSDEYLDYAHLLRLRDACLGIDWSSLPVDRTPAIEPVGRFTSYPTGLFPEGFGDKPDDRRAPPAKTSLPKPKTVPPPAAEKSGPVSFDVVDEIDGMTVDQVIEFIETDTVSAALLMIDLAAELQAARAKVALYRNSLG